MKKFVINPLNHVELMDFLDDKAKEIIKYFIVKSLFAQPETKIGQNTLPIQIPKEHMEQWFTQALDVKPVGAGSYPIDIYNEREHWGADIKMLNIKVGEAGDIINTDSGEASLGQNFSDAGNKLDSLFHSGYYNKIKNNWVELYREKYETLKINYPSIKKIYYFFILRPGVQSGGANFYFTGAVVNLENLGQVRVNKKRTTSNSVFLDGFIDSDFGNTKIYKAKKRLELRLKPSRWIDFDMAIEIKTSFSPASINLRDINIGPEYLQEQINAMKDIKLDFIA